MSDQETQLQKSYNELSQYPSQEMRYYRTKHEIMKQNLLSIIPNVEYENLRKTFTKEEQIDWFHKANNYAAELFNTFQERWNKEYQQLQKNIHTQERINEFDITAITEKLPEDIIRYIQEFLPYETRYVYLVAKYPNLNKAMETLKLSKLTYFLKNTMYKNHYLNIVNNQTVEGRTIRNMLPYNFYMKTTTSTKRCIIAEVYRIMNIYHKIDPKTITKDSLTIYEYYQKEALKILHAMIYISKINQDKKEKESNKTKNQPKKRKLLTIKK